MFKKKECIAMLLAGGQGSRLLALTEKTAKPAVSFGGKYRIIDFPLSNCINSGLDTVGVLTQYQPLRLSEYIGNGLPWDLDRTFGGVKILPPYQGKDGADWYRGTANAIWQNAEFIDRYSPEYVLVLSGDHIYKMDYAGMLAHHKEQGADCTVAVIDVPLEEASRFGIVSTDGAGRILRFREKPKDPDGTKASMGIYIFDWALLRRYLEEDARRQDSSNDFGKDVIPAMLAGGERLFAYPFSGYWKDVGTVRSLWEANMDLLGDRPVLSLSDEGWRIYSRHGAEGPQFVGEGADLRDSSVTAGCEILGEVTHSVLGPSVTVEAGASVQNSVLMSGVRVCRGARVRGAILDENVTIGEDAEVGRETGDAAAITVVGADTVVPAGAQIFEKEE